MTFEKNLDKFLDKYQIDKQSFNVCGISWEDLCSIAEKKELDESKFRSAAITVSNFLQEIPEVHSVRWRIKDTEHLMAKIIRKLDEKSEKYLGINSTNYDSIVKDIVGIRALHLFKEDFLQIDREIRNSLMLDRSEEVIAYIRKGDETEFNTQIGLQTQIHKAGYRSIHYIFLSNTFKQSIFGELQVRTIFEEGWSEIDHKIRYPNLVDNELINQYLFLFNRLCGSADDMGSYVNALASGIKNYESEITEVRQRADDDKNKFLLEMEKMLDQLESEKNHKQKQSKTIQDLKAELSRYTSKSNEDLNSLNDRIALSLIGNLASVKAKNYRDLLASLNTIDPKDLNFQKINHIKIGDLLKNGNSQDENNEN